MSIPDAEIVGSPGWWMSKLFEGLQAKERRNRLDNLHKRYRGQSPLPEAADSAREIFYNFQRKARTNFAQLIVSAVSERMRVSGFRTASDFDETGDSEAGELWLRAGLDVESNDTHDKMLNLSECFVVVGEYDDEIAAPVVTVEDPRTMISAADPLAPRRMIASLKVLHDPITEQDQAYLYLPGRFFGPGKPAQIRVAVSNTRTTGLSRVPFDPKGWSWNNKLSGELAHPRIPVVRFLNKDAVGEYELHTDLLDRINHQVLQRMVIATMQAFRQRAVSGLPVEDEQGNEIDYSQVFTMDPAALWQLPSTAKMWESGQVDLTPILSAVKDDISNLAAVTETPMHMLSPAGVNQSAEGASLVREGLVQKTQDRIDRTRSPWAQVMGLCFLQSGDTTRADIRQLQTMFASPERLSFAERADAASKAQNDIPRRSRLIHIWQFSPAEADRMMSEWEEEQLVAAAAQAAADNALAAQQQAAAATEQQQIAPVDELDLANLDQAVNLGTDAVPAGSA
ncbi:MAG: phage portal protein [Mycobacterium sp.]